MSAIHSRRRRRRERNPNKDYSAYWFAALLALVAIYVMVKDLGYL